MKKYVLGVLIGFVLLIYGCKDEKKEINIQDMQEDVVSQNEKITIMHIDAEVPGFQEFIKQAEKELNLEIQVISYPANADVRQANIQDMQEDVVSQNEKITIMHIDAEVPGFQEFIKQAEKELNLEIQVISYPANADVRQAKISTILAAGESSVDIFSVNDEMVSEFKYQGYLEPLNDPCKCRCPAS